MKKILLLNAIALFAYGAAFAQFNKGRMLAGGSIGFSSSTDTETYNGTTNTVGTITTLTFSPNFGYFIIDNFAVGGNLSYSNSNDKESGSNNTSSKLSTFTFNPFVRYYFGPGVFGQGAYGFGSGKNEYTYNSNSSTSTLKYSVDQWSLGIGYAIFLNDHVAIEPIFAYQSQSKKVDGSGNAKDISSGVALNIGIQVYLGERGSK